MYVFQVSIIELYYGGVNMFDVDYEQFIRERIGILRVQKNVSARDMSLSIGQSENYINMIENGRSLPSMTVFLYICDYFGIEPKDFFDTGNNQPTIIKDIVEELKKLEYDQLVSILTLIKNFIKEK